jgi:hypothetical protein
MLLGKDVLELTVTVLAVFILGREGGGEMLDLLHHLNFVGLCEGSTGNSRLWFFLDFL